MELFKNPFYILGATPRDNRKRIMELAEERSLVNAPDACAAARSDLTNPRKRLAAEVGWLPGVGPKRARELLSILETAPEDVFEIKNLPPMAKANLLVAGLARLPEYSAAIFANWTIEIVEAFDAVTPENLSVIINDERVAAGITEVSDLSVIETEIKEQQHFYVQVIESVFKKLSLKEALEAMTDIVDYTTLDGEQNAPVLIDDLVDAYEVKVQSFFEKAEVKIQSLIDKLRESVDAEEPDEILAPMVNQLISTVKKWDTVAQPIQVSARSRGTDHAVSHRMARMIRELTLHMNNEHGKVEFAQQLTKMLQEVFEEVDEWAERAAEDADALEGIAEQKSISKKISEIDELISQIKTDLDNGEEDSHLSPILNQLCLHVLSWEIDPKHDASVHVAWLVRDLAIHLFNEGGKLEFAQQLTFTLQQVFSGVDKIAERIDEDTHALENIAKQREESKRREEEWRKEITYEANIGTMFKDKLRISPEGIDWKGRHYNFEQITWATWFVEIVRTNVIVTETTYRIEFGNESKREVIDLTSMIANKNHKEIYTNFVDRLWKAVAPRLITKCLEELRDGKTYKFLLATLHDNGIEFEEAKWFGKGKKTFCNWNELTIWNKPGAFCIGKSSDEEYVLTMSYNYGNAHIFESIIRMFWKTNHEKLSSLLEY